MDKMKCSHLENHNMIEVCLSHELRAQSQFRESCVNFYIKP